MKYTVQTTKNFEKSFKLCQRRGYPMEKLLVAVSLLENTGTLPQQYRPHKLQGYAGNNTWECLE